MLPPGPEMMIPSKEEKREVRPQVENKDSTTTASTDGYEEYQRPKSGRNEVKEADREAVGEDIAKEIKADNRRTDRPDNAAEDMPLKPPSESSAFKLVNQIACVPVFHRVFSSRKKFNLFGRPFMVSFDRTTTTHKHIHQMIFDRVARYVLVGHRLQSKLTSTYAQVCGPRSAAV